MGMQMRICYPYIYLNKHLDSISHRTTFSHNLHLVEGEALECLPILQNLYHNFPTAYLKQTSLGSWDNIYFGLPYLSQESMVVSQIRTLSWAFSYSLKKCIITKKVKNNHKIDKWIINKVS